MELDPITVYGSFVMLSTTEATIIIMPVDPSSSRTQTWSPERPSFR